MRRRRCWRWRRCLQVGQDWGGGIAWLMSIYYPQVCLGPAGCGW